MPQGKGTYGNKVGRPKKKLKKKKKWQKKLNGNMVVKPTQGH